MLKNFFNLYVIFAMFMIVAVFIHFDSPLLHTYKDINVILQEVDFTGLTGTFRIIFLITNVMVLLICILAGIVIDGRGKKFNYNKIVALIFLFLAIMPFMACIITRDEEKKQVQELQLEEETEKLFGGIFDLTKKEDIQLLEKRSNSLKTDPFFVRKMQIAKQEENSTILEVLGEFFTYGIFKGSEDIKKDLEIYYAAFPGYTYIAIICVIFYGITAKVKNSEEEILEEGECI